MHLWWQVIEQEGEGIIDQFGINDVVVVEDEDEIVRDGVNFVEQGRQDRFGWRWPGGLERAQHPFSDIRCDRLQSGDEVSEEACGIVVPFVQRHPGGRSLATGDPFADQRGFTKAGGGRDEGQFAAQTLVQMIDQAWAEDDSRLRWGDIKFSGQNWRGHRSIIKATATGVRADPPEHKPYGVRVYSVTDPGGHSWSFWQHPRDEVELPEGWKEVRNS